MPDEKSDQQKIEEDAVRKEQERQEQARRDQDKLQNELIAADNVVDGPENRLTQAFVPGSSARVQRYCAFKGFSQG